MGVFAMPSLGADMEAGTLVEWMIAPGDRVRRGDIIAVVETQKGAIEIETFEEGTVAELIAELGQSLPVGTPMAVILAEDEAAPRTALPSVAESGTPAKPPETGTKTPRMAPPQAAPDAAFAASPAARVRAREMGLDLAALSGSGPGGAVLLADVEAVATASPVGKTPTADPMAEMRKAIAAAMVRSKQTIPHFYLSQTIDVQPAIDWLAALNEARPPAGRVLLGALFVRAATLAAARVEVMNGHHLEDGFHPADRVNPALVVALRGGGLVAPAIMDAEKMTLDETMAAMRDLVTRARAGRLRGSEMTQGTITISSLGDTGAEAMAGVIFPPQVALVGLGAPHLRPWVVDGEVVPRSLVTLTLSADHRVSDGRQAARFIAEFEARIQSPETL